MFKRHMCWKEEEVDVNKWLVVKYGIVLLIVTNHRD